MNKKLIMKLVLISIFIVLFNNYVSNNFAYHTIISKWFGYILPLVWGIFIAILMAPAVYFFENKLKIKRSLSIFIVILLFILFIIGIFLLIVPQIVDSVKELYSKSDFIVDRTNDFINTSIKFLNERGILFIDSKEVMQKITIFLKGNIGSLKSIVFSVIMNIFWWTIGIFNLCLGFMLAILMIMDKEESIQTRDNIILIIFGNKKSDYLIKKINEANDIFLNYIVGKIVVSIFMSLVVGLILLLSGTPYAIMIGLMIGLGNVIPYVGSIIFGAISIFLVMIMEPSKIIFLIISMIVVQTLDGFVLGPKIVGDKVGLNSFWVIVSIMLFGGMFGIVGMFLAVPIMCVIKSFYKDLLQLKINKREE